MSRLAIGLMSGTSADGVSAAFVSFKNHSFNLIRYQTFPYSKKVRQKILAALELKTPEISELNFLLGRIFARAALKIIRLAGTRRKNIAVIGSHGQTIYHGPRDRVPSTFQIGEAAVIAEKTGIPVVSDFRPQDIALRGEGAPLVPFFDYYFYGNGPLRAFQNMGGIGNVTLVGRNFKPVAFDTGPGNCLIDLAVSRITKNKMNHDPSGKWAAQGKINHALVRSMMKHPFFKRKPPKSTGREEFGGQFLRKYFGPRLTRQPFDAIATLTYFTALTIHESISKLTGRGKGEGLRVKEMIVSGGGVKNLTLMQHLKELFTPTPVRSIEEWHIPAQAKEPIAFAFFALRALEGKINHLPSATGAQKACVLGKLTNASAMTI